MTILFVLTFRLGLLHATIKVHFCCEKRRRHTQASRIMASIRLLSVMLFFTWMFTSNALRSTGNKGHGSIDHVDHQEQRIVSVDKATDDNEGPKHGFPRVVMDYGYDDVNNETDYIEGPMPVYKGYAGVVENNSVNLRHVDPVSYLWSHLTTTVLPILYIIVFVVGLPANTMALWVFLFRTKKKRPSAIYMANLALSDVSFAIWIPLKIAYHFNGNDWIYGEGLCKVLVGFFYGNMYCSTLFIACLSVQRYRVVVDPFSEQNNKMAIGVCVSIWVFIWTTTTPLYLYDHTVRVKYLNITTCHDVSAIWDINNPFASVKYPYYYFMSMATVVFFIFIVIVVAYVRMLWHLEKTTVRNVNRTAEKNRHKALVLIATVTFLVCFIPSNIMLVIHYSLLRNGETNTGYGNYSITLCLASLNSCLDPCIYYFVSDDFRKHVKNTLRCRSRRTVESIESVEKYCRNNKSYVPGDTDSSRGE